jgi:hypothetical protein
MNLKFKIAKMIAGGTIYSECANYQELIEAIYDNRYRTIDKCPIDLYLLGIVESFVIKDIDHANKILNVLKEVTQDIFETTGTELTYTDEDWSNLQFIENTGWNKERVKFVLPKLNKSYMSEFFEN